MENMKRATTRIVHGASIGRLFGELSAAKLFSQPFRTRPNLSRDLPKFLFPFDLRVFLRQTVQHSAEVQIQSRKAAKVFAYTTLSSMVPSTRILR